MTDHPIIFSAEMIRQLLSGKKIMTRRLLYSDRVAKNGIIPASTTFLENHKPPHPAFTHYWVLTPWHTVKAGDRLYVREAFSYQEIDGDRIEEFGGIHYWADGDPQFGNWTRPKPSIHLPRTLSRITLIVTSAKIERLQDITEEDARAEGVSPRICGIGFNNEPIRGHRTGFVHLWGSLHGTDSWLDNPHVVALSFRVVAANIDSPEAKAA